MRYKEELLGDYIDILSGFAFKTKDFVDKGVPIIKIKNISPPCVTLDDLTYVSNEVAEKQKKFSLSYDDVLIAMTGSHINQWASVVGRVARVKYSDSTLLNQRVGKITIKDNTEVDINYIYYYISQDTVKIELAAKAGGAANQANISPAHIKGLSFPCPDLATQYKIGNILRSYDDLIENNQKQIKLLEEAAQRLYKEWFVDLHFPGYKDVDIVDGVPEGWNKELIGNVIGKVSRTKQIKTADYLLEGSIPIIDQSRDFIAGYTNDSEALVNTGTPVIVFGDHTRILKYIQFPFAKGADGTQLIISDRTNMPQSLLYLSLIAVDLSNYHYARHFKYLKAASILMPSQDVADEFDRLISPIFTQIQKMREKCYKLSQARDRLLPKLMSGEIEV